MVIRGLKVAVSSLYVVEVSLKATYSQLPGQIHMVWCVYIVCFLLYM